MGANARAGRTDRHQLTALRHPSARGPVLFAGAGQRCPRSTTCPPPTSRPARWREAWLLPAMGSDGAAQHGAVAAGRLRPEDRARLERAVRRYARHVDHRPERLPAAPLAALLALAGASGDWTLARTIRRLDQLSRRMRSHATAADPARHEAAGRRAQRRHQDPPPVASPTATPTTLACAAGLTCCRRSG
jgi:hypothetical protein